MSRKRKLPPPKPPYVYRQHVGTYLEPELARIVYHLGDGNSSTGLRRAALFAAGLPQDHVFGDPYLADSDPLPVAKPDWDDIWFPFPFPPEPSAAELSS